jgi:hypothetical protein
MPVLGSVGSVGAQVSIRNKGVYLLVQDANSVIG